ncbi:MAG TPA: hypothetical protein VFC63_28415 [Blastocatellia bacterium]|nr:hypothetical protein [Blastocatellia bacterium]
MNLKRYGFAFLMLLLANSAVLAQRSDDDGAAGCAACGGFMVVMIVAIIIGLAINIALLVWVARDAKARGMDSAVLWMILVMVTSWVGLLIYIFSRPQGNLIRCMHCNNNRLQASAKCPHCGNA